MKVNPQKDIVGITFHGHSRSILHVMFKHDLKAVYNHLKNCMMVEFGKIKEEDVPHYIATDNPEPYKSSYMELDLVLFGTGTEHYRDTMQHVREISVALYVRYILGQPRMHVDKVEVLDKTDTEGLDHILDELNEKVKSPDVIYNQWNKINITNEQANTGI